MNLKGLTTSYLFSSAAPDLSASKTKRFIRCYITSLRNPFDTSHAMNLSVGSPHELGWFLRWALSRLVRIIRIEEPVPSKGPGKGKGRVVKTVKEYGRRGMVDMREYVMWREKERGTSSYPFTICATPKADHDA